MRSQEAELTYYYYVLAEGVLGLRINRAGFAWSYGITAPEASRTEYDLCRLRFTLEVGDDHIFPPEQAHRLAEEHGKYHYFMARPGEDSIYYQRTFAFGKLLQLQVSGLVASEPTVRVNRTYFKYIKHRFMNLHSVGYILTDVASLLLLRLGLAPVHCSAFATDRGTALIAAPPNTGKTLSTMMACIDHGASFMSEDLAITDGDTVYAVPWTSTFRYYSKLDRSLRSRWLGALTNRLPVLELLPGARVQPISDYVPVDRIVPQAPLTHLIILQRGERSVQRIGAEDALVKIANLNRFEFNYHRAPLVVAYEYFNPSLDIRGAIEAEHRILRKVAHSAAEVMIIQSPDPTEYAATILREMAGEATIPAPRERAHVTDR